MAELEGDAPVLYARREAVATITLNRPARRNALDFPMRDMLAEFVTQVRRDRGIKVLVLRGAGGAFCAGGDISTMGQVPDAEAARDRMVALHGVVQDLLTLDRPILAAVDGPAYGAGFGLALTADMIFATPRAQFCLSFLRLGAVPDSGVFYTLPRIVGVQRAKALAFSTEPFDAAAAQAMGIVFEVTPAEAVAARVDQVAHSLAQLPLGALSLTKRAFNASLDSSLTTMLEMEASAQGVARASDFHRDAVQRFLNKQASVFTWPAAAAAGKD